MPESINSSGYINKQSRRNQNNQSSNGMNCRFAATRQHPQPDLDDINDGKHQEKTAHDRANSGGHHAKPEDLQVDVGTKGLINIFAVQQVDGEFEALSDEGGEKEEAEGDNLEDKKLLGDVDAGITGVGVLETVLTRGGQGETNKNSDCEERVDVDDPI